MGDLRDFMTALNDAEDDLSVSVTVAPRTNHPTDPGGEITLSVTVPR